MCIHARMHESIVSCMHIGALASALASMRRANYEDILSGTVKKVVNGACDHFCICGDDNDDNPDSDDKDCDIESYHDKAFCGRGVDYALNDWYDETVIGAMVRVERQEKTITQLVFKKVWKKETVGR